MASQATAQLLTKGPLSSAIGQWAFLGFGTFVIFTGDNGVSKAAQQIAGVAYRLATGRDLGGGVDLLREAALGSQANSSFQSGGMQPQQPIVIHSHAPSADGKRGGWTAMLVQFTLASGACWGAYILFSNYLPDSIKEMMPVTRKFFETAVSSLGNGIIKVRDALSEQIATLGKKQDELASKQDETHDSVLGLKDDIGDVRLNIDDIAVAISRCEGSLTDAAGRQTYMSRGMRLLVQCVGDLLRPSNPDVAEELDQFSRLSSELMDDDFQYRDGDKRGGRGGSLDKRGPFECPSSPNLSEIGSTTSTSIDDHHHHNMRSFSLPRPARRSQSIVTPVANNSTAPNSASRISLMGMSSPPPALKMLQSFNSASGSGRSSNGTASTASLSRSHSSPEDGVPGGHSSSSSGRATPASYASDPVRLDEVTDLLSNIRNGVPVR